MLALTIKGKGRGRIPSHVNCKCGKEALLTSGRSRRCIQSHKRKASITYKCSSGHSTILYYVVDESGKVIMAMGHVNPKDIVVR